MFWQNTGDDTENRFPCIFFKVVDIRGKQTAHKNFVMDKDNTRLIQVNYTGGGEFFVYQCISEFMSTSSLIQKQKLIKRTLFSPSFKNIVKQ